ncbi:MAG: radical SAM protein [Acidobacteriota bacterium]|nr:radical SAM protein [Acidobacteriota bacterium]
MTDAPLLPGAARRGVAPSGPVAVTIGHPPRALKQFVIKPTVFCYHRCPYCDLRQEYYKELVAERKRALPLLASGTRRPNPGHMPRDMALRLVDEAAALGMEELQLSGGDPLLYPHLLDVIRAARGHPGVFVLMNSVGTGVSEDAAAEIIDAGLGAWNFSIDTLDPEKYDRLRGVRGALPTILAATETVRRAAAGRSDFRMNYMTVITRSNYRDIPSVIDHALQNNIASVYLMNVYGDQAGASLLNIDDIAEFRQGIVPEILAVLRRRDVAQVVQDNAARVLGTFFSADNPDSNYAAGVYWPDADAARRACRLPDHYSLVEPDGRVLPCCLVEIAQEGEVGSVVDESLAQVFNGGAFDRFRQDRIPFCLTCSSPRNMTLGLIPSMCRQFRD